jgi:hypothetical protein
MEVREGERSAVPVEQTAQIGEDEPLVNSRLAAPPAMPRLSTAVDNYI